MIGKLEFRLPEENNEFKLAQRGGEYFSTIWNIINILRDYRKEYCSAQEAIERIGIEINLTQIEDIE